MYAVKWVGARDVDDAIRDPDSEIWKWRLSTRHVARGVLNGVSRGASKSDGNFSLWGAVKMNGASKIKDKFTNDMSGS